MKTSYKKTFLKCLSALDTQEQRRVLDTLQEIETYFATGKATYGLRIKKLGGHTYEGRVSDALRIVWVHSSDEVIFSLLGNHEEVKRFIRNM